VAVREDTVGSRVDLGFYPPSNNVLTNYWDAATDGGALLVNALRYAATRPPLAPGDSEGDGDVDLVDLAGMDACWAIAADGNAPAGCITFDLDSDGDVDCIDQFYFRGLWTNLETVPPLSEACRYAVPAMAEWHLVNLTLLLLIGGSLILRGRQA
jgi:hypothetical protein